VPHGERPKRERVTLHSVLFDKLRLIRQHWLEPGTWHRELRTKRDCFDRQELKHRQPAAALMLGHGTAPIGNVIGYERDASGHAIRSTSAPR
jgi:hypothetical protein